MKRKTIVLLCATLLLAGALAQDATQPNLEIRLSIVESRLTRVEADVSKLSSVPTQLARIEEKLTALAEKADGQGGVLQTVGVGITMALLGGGIGWLFKGKRG